MKELETRIVDIDVDDIREKLLSLGGKKVKSEDQVNEIYDFEDGRLLSAKGYARIRTVTDRLSNKEITFMTTKKMLSQDTFKVMEENETIIMDAEMGRRESYELENALVEIDINDKSFCPFPYIEIETDSIENLEKVVTSLGYTLEDTTSQTIYDILAERGITGSTPGR